MNAQRRSVNLVPGMSAPAVLHASEGDVGRVLEIVIIDGQLVYNIPSTATVTITATKPSGMGFTQACTVTENGTATFETTASMTDESGKMQAEVRIVDGGQNIGTANLLWVVERNPHPSNVIDGDVEQAKTILERAEEAMTKAEQMIEEVEIYNSIVEEVEDARNGFDGVEYGTLGDAVRGQVDTLQGEIDKLNDGGLIIKDDVIEADVNEWLDKHPEATTTVQDGAITLKKLSPETIAFIKESHIFDVTDYGINPNTGTDIYNGLFDFLKSKIEGKGGIVFFPDGEYIVSDTIFIPSNTIFLGSGKNTVIKFNEQYQAFGTALSNGGDNVGIVNMTVDCDSYNVTTGSMTGAIGFSTVDSSTMSEPHPTEFPSRKDMKNLFVYNIWTNTKYVLQTETEESYTISNVTYRNIYAEKSLVSVQGKAKISNVVIDNVICGFLRVGRNYSVPDNEVTISNTKCGRAELHGDIVANNLVVDYSLRFDDLSSIAVQVGGNVMLSNAVVNAESYEYAFGRYNGRVWMCNVNAFGGVKAWTNVRIDDGTYKLNDFVNCDFAYTGDEIPYIYGTASNSNISSAGELKNRQRYSTELSIGKNTNISPGKMKASMDVYDMSVVHVRGSLVLNDTEMVFKVPVIYALYGQAMIGYAWNATSNIFVPCILTCNESGEWKATSISTTPLTECNRITFDAMYVVDIV